MKYPDHPVFLDRVDGHIAVANTRALQWPASRSHEGTRPAAKIDSDTTGTGTGFLRETYVDRQAVTPHPKPTHDKRGKHRGWTAGNGRSGLHFQRSGQFRFR
jgi:predicted amidohydrolase YtcJ